MKGFNHLAATAADVAARYEQIDRLLDLAQIGALILGLKANIAWATCGADLGLAASSERAFGFAVFTPGRRQVVTWVMDVDRFLDEELPDGFEVVPVRWDESWLDPVAIRLAGDRGVLSDCGLPGTEPADAALRLAQYPMSQLEHRRLTWIGARLDALCRAAAARLEPGTTEREASAALTADFQRDGFAIHEMIVGFDERIRRYRHPVPREGRLERSALLHPTVSRWGLHGTVTRMVHLGPPPTELMERFATCSSIEAWSIAMSTPGTTFGAILEGQRRRYQDAGYPGAWHDHFQGGLTGFVLHEPAHATRPDDGIPEGAILNWYPSLPGAKKEELTVATPEGGRPISLTGAWPTEPIDTEAGRVSVATLLVR